MFRVNIVLVVLVAIARAQIPSLGFCPEYPPMADFNLNRFLGKWYEVERYFQISEVAARCVVTDYAKAASGRIFVSNEVTNRLTGVKRIIGGFLELAGRADEGKLRVKYTTTPISSETVLTVLDTDYESYAVIWSCSGLGPIHAQSIWVMTRERIPPGPVLQSVYGILDKFKISRTFFVKTDQEGCALAASDINAANGINTISTVAEATGSEQRIKIPPHRQSEYEDQKADEAGVKNSSDDSVGENDEPQIIFSEKNEDEDREDERDEDRDEDREEEDDE